MLTKGMQLNQIASFQGYKKPTQNNVQLSFERKIKEPEQFKLFKEPPGALLTKKMYG